MGITVVLGGLQLSSAGTAHGHSVRGKYAAVAVFQRLVPDSSYL